MFRSAFYSPIPEDPFNLLRNRNIRNTHKGKFNCGGYALGTFSWYCPHRREDDVWGNYFADTEEEILAITERSIRTMLEDFKGRLRVISGVAEADLRTETVIAFRIAPQDDDFHFVRRGCNGNWYHKRGGCPWIERMDTMEVFSDDWVFGYLHYNGPLVLFALKK